MTDTDILAFLKARLDEDEQTARDAEADLRGATWQSFADALWKRTDHVDSICDHVERHDPSRVLREVALKRYLLELHSPYTDGMCSGCTGGPAPFGDVPSPCSHVRAMAAIWSDHPDYNPSWTVET